MEHALRRGRTPEQEAALQAVRDQIAAGELDDLFGQIKGEAYGG